MEWYKLNASVSGIFHALADQGDLVKKNQIIGRITDVDGTELSKLESPIDGVVHTMFPRRIVYLGDPLYTLLKIGPRTGY